MPPNLICVQQQPIGYAPQQVLGIAPMPPGINNVNGGYHLAQFALPIQASSNTNINYVPPFVTVATTNIPPHNNVCSIGMVTHGHEPTVVNKQESRFFFIIYY